MKNTILFLIAVIVSTGLSAQTFSPKVVPSTGGYGTAAGNTYSFTIGEPNIQYLQTSAALEQGFEHGELDIVTGALSEGTYCAGADVNVPFTATGIFNSDNVFTAQLSDASGSFTSAVNIGTLSATTSGSISATIPSNTTAGTGYRIRVTGSDVVLNGKDNGSDITVNALTVSPTAGSNIATANQIVWEWNSATYATGYKWNTTNDYSSATDNGISTNYTQTGLSDNTPYTLYVWAYNSCGNSSSVTLNQTTSGTPGLWVGITNNWNTTTNWSDDNLPTSSVNVTIPTSPAGGHFPVITTSGSALCNNITIDNGATMTVSASDDISVYGNITDNNSSSNYGAGTIIFAGTSQSISGNITIGNININSGATVTINSDNTVSVTGVLISDGTFNSNGGLTLISNSSGTALISGAGEGTVSGTVYEQRYIPGSAGLHLIGSAFSNATFSQLTNLEGTFVPGQAYTNTGTVSNLWLYTESIISGNAQTDYTLNDGWNSPSALSNTINPMQGFAAYMSGPSTFTLYGTVINGDQNLNGLTYTLHTNDPSGPPINYQTENSGWQLISNPYPSPIDWEAVNLTNISPTVSVYQPVLGGNGYQWNTCTQSGITENNGSRYIPAMQAFFIQVAPGGDGSVGFTNEARVNQNPSFYKKEDSSDNTLLKLQLKAADTNYAPDETVIDFDSNATLDFDINYDSYKLFNSGDVLNLYTVLNDNMYSINCLPYSSLQSSVSSLQIPLGYMVGAAGSFSINTVQMLNFNADWNVYLVDTLTGTVQNLMTNPTYTFNVKKNGLDAVGRLFIKFVNNTTTGIQATASSKQQAVNIFAYQNKLYVTCPEGGADMFIYDVTGRQVSSFKFKDLSNTIDLNYLAKGCYLVKVLNNNVMTVRKVVVN